MMQFNEGQFQWYELSYKTLKLSTIHTIYIGLCYCIYSEIFWNYFRSSINVVVYFISFESSTCEADFNSPSYHYVSWPYIFVLILVQKKWLCVCSICWFSYTNIYVVVPRHFICLLDILYTLNWKYNLLLWTFQDNVLWTVLIIIQGRCEPGKRFSFIRFGLVLL